MTEPAFFSGLIQAAHETDQLTKPECSKLLKRAAAIMQAYQDQSAFVSDRRNGTETRDIASEFRELADNLDAFSEKVIAEKLLEAVAVIKALRVVMEAKAGH